MSQQTPYDQVPYKSYPYPQSHPIRLATVATLLGMKPADVRQARVLELGCCTGGNLLPIAQQFPRAQFVGIDASSRQVADGQTVVDAQGLKNVRLLAEDILQVTPTLGRFDYIIAHGVYSWVPPQVQDKILSICSENLAPAGVAYVSYNTFPGWRMRGIIRDIMLYRARRYRDPGQRVSQARALVDFLAKTVAKEDNPYGLLLSKELDLLKSKEENYLLHDFLEEANEPVYFHEFAERAEQHDLQYLGEADFGAMSIRNLPASVRPVLQAVADGVLELEQYMDLIRNRMFRQTLLVHAGTNIDRAVPPERLLGLHIASPLKPEKPVTDPKADEKVSFRAQSGVTSTTDGLVKAALLHLGELWPRSVPFTQLVATARSRLSGSPSIVDAGHAGADSRRLAEPLIRCYETDQAEISVLPSTFTLDISDRPLALPLARMQAERGGEVTNLKHELVRLDDLDRHVLRHLDGRHDRSHLLEELVRTIDAGDLLLHEPALASQAPMSKERAVQLIEPAVDSALLRLAHRFLLAPTKAEAAM